MKETPHAISYVTNLRTFQERTGASRSVSGPFPQIPKNGFDEPHMAALKNQLRSFESRGEGYSKTAEIKILREGIALNVTSSEQQLLKEKGDGDLSRGIELKKIELLTEGGEALKQAFPLYDLLSRLEDAPEKAEHLRKICLEGYEEDSIARTFKEKRALKKEKNFIPITLTPSEYTFLASSLNTGRSVGN